MIRERYTARKRKAEDVTGGQNANGYWRKKALEAVRSLLTETEEEELKQYAQEIADEDARETGASPMVFVPQEAAAVEEAEVQEVEVEDAAGELEDVVEEEENVKMAKVFVPNTRKASEVEPGVEDTIGQDKWFEMKDKFPTKTRGMKLLDVVSSKGNEMAVMTIARKLDRVASMLEEKGMKDAAVDLDIISNCLEWSVNKK